MTTNYFALLGEPRRPWLDPEQLTHTFHRLSRTVHPDQTAGDNPACDDAAFQELNEAHQTLSDPKRRLGHLLSLEFPDIRLSGPSPVPATLAEDLGPILDLLQKVDALLARKAAAPSALARALLTRDELLLRDQTEARAQTVSVQYAQALADLRAFDAQWPTRPPDAGANLLDLYQRFAYLSRWTEQLRERLYLLGQ